MFSAAPETLTRGSISAEGGYPPPARATPVSASQSVDDELGARRPERAERDPPEGPEAAQPHVGGLPEPRLGHSLARGLVLDRDLRQHGLEAALRERVRDRGPGAGGDAAAAEVRRRAGVLQ